MLLKEFSQYFKREKMQTSTHNISHFCKTMTTKPCICAYIISMHSTKVQKINTGLVYLAGWGDKKKGNKVHPILGAHIYTCIKTRTDQCTKSAMIYFSITGSGFSGSYFVTLLCFISRFTNSTHYFIVRKHQGRYCHCISGL